jgi:hypothetical protein
MIIAVLHATNQISLQKLFWEAKALIASLHNKMYYFFIKKLSEI